MEADVLNLDSFIAVTDDLCSTICVDLDIPEQSEINQVIELASTLEGDLEMCSSLDLEWL